MYVCMYGCRDVEMSRERERERERDHERDSKSMFCLILQVELKKAISS